MYKLSYFYAFFLFATNKILSVKSNLLDGTTTVPLSSECGTSIIPSIKPESPIPGVPICKGSEDVFISYGIINGLQNIQLFEQRPGKPNTNSSLCDNTELITLLAKEFGVCPKKNQKCGEFCFIAGLYPCDFTYVVFIFTEIKGKMVQICQGVILADGSILTIYECTQIGQGLWIQPPNSDGKLQQVDCMTGPKEHANPDGFADKIFSVRLILKSNCSSDGLTSNQRVGILTDVLGTIKVELDASSAPFVSGYLVVKDDCSSDKYSIKCKSGLLISNAGFVIFDKQDDLCFGYQGALFIGEDGLLYGMAIHKTELLKNLKSALPELKTALDVTRCLIPIIKVHL